MIKRNLILFCIAALIAAHTSAQSFQLEYTIIPESPRPGDHFTIGANKGITSASLFVDGKMLTSAYFYEVKDADGKPEFIAAVLAIPSTVNPGQAIIRLEGKKNLLIGDIPVIIANRSFESETIYLDDTLTSIRTDSSRRRYLEDETLQKILDTAGIEIYHTGTFTYPVNSRRITSIYGNRRLYKYSSGGSGVSIHAGIDIGVPTGTQVYACGAGRIALTADRIITGNSIVIEHSPGIYSLYFHLNKIEVRENQIVKQGDLIAFSGSTGLATGPHLHWEIRINGINTDPDSLVEHPVIDKNLILSKTKRIIRKD